MSSATTNYGWALPDVGGSTGSWGSTLNTALSTADADLHAVSVAAAAALPKAGGVMTGKIDLLTASAARIDLGSISGTHTFDLAVAQAYTFTVGGALTVAFANWPAGTVVSAVMFKMGNPGAFPITWPAGTKWSNGSVPVFTAAGTDRIAFISDDAGASAHGIVVGQAIA